MLEGALLQVTEGTAAMKDTFMMFSSTRLASDMRGECSQAVEEVLAAAPERETIEEYVARKPGELDVAVDLEEDDEVPEFQEEEPATSSPVEEVVYGATEPEKKLVQLEARAAWNAPRPFSALPILNKAKKESAFETWWNGKGAQYPKGLPIEFQGVEK